MKNKVLQDKHVQPTVKMCSVSIMLWGCVASAATGNLVNVEGHMDSSQYQQIFANTVQELETNLKLTWGWMLKQDNNPKHCSKSVYIAFHCNSPTKISLGKVAFSSTKRQPKHSVHFVMLRRPH